MARSGQLTKTVLISGGMSDDIPEYLKENPTCAYIENGRFRKKDEIEKRLPVTALDDTNLPVSGNPIILTTDGGDTLATLDDDGVLYQYDPTDDLADWQVQQTDILPYDATVDFDTSAEPGMGIIAAGESTYVTTGLYKMVAWEVRQPNADATTTTPVSDVIIELQSASGKLITRERIEDAYSPKIVQNGTGNTPMCFYTTSDGSIYAAYETGTFSITTVDTGIDTSAEHPEVAGYLANYATGGILRDVLHPGWMKSSGGAGVYAIDYSGSDGVLAYYDTATNQVRAIKMFGAATTGLPATLLADASQRVGCPLAVALDPFDEIAIVICSYTNTDDGEGDLRFIKVDYSGANATLAGSDTYDPNSLGTLRRFVNASVVHDGSRFRWAATYVGGDPNYMSGSTFPGSRDLPTVAVGLCTDTPTATVDQAFRDHRITSEVVLASYSPVSDLLVTMEQWAPYACPRSRGLGRKDEFASVPALIKPVTTLVVSCTANGTNDEYKIVAALGSGQTKGHNASCSMQNTHLNGSYLHTGDNRPRIVTRTILQPEDISVFMGADDSADPEDRYSLLFSGEATARIYKLTVATSWQSREYGKGTICASAFPCYYDGKAFGELSVLDQPEISWLRSSTSATDYISWAYEQGLAKTDPEDWYVFQVVLGFADALGNLHRSAPSTPVWVAGIQPSDWVSDADTNLDLGFTMPLSAFRDNRDYFVEVYVAEGEAAPHLAATRNVSVLNASSGDNAVTFKLNVHVNKTAGDDADKPVRWSEVLYTEGDVLPADPWPYLSDFVITSNRLFGIGAEIPGTIYYSKLFEEKIAPEFSAPLVISLGRDRAITGIGTIDDKVVVFTKNEIFAIYDTGPDNTGAGGDFIVDRIQTTIGCTDGKSVVEVPEGLFFYSSVSGEFHFISRDLQIHDLGAPVEDISAQIDSITGALVIPAEDEVHWYISGTAASEYGAAVDTGAGIPVSPPRPRLTNPLPNGCVLVYNYAYKKWCVHSGKANVRHAVLYQNKETYINSSFNAFQTDETAWGEDTTNLLKIRLPWFRINQLQSLGRIEELAFLGKYYSAWKDNGNGHEAGDVQVVLTYDYEEYNAASDTYRFRANKGDLGTSGGRMQFSAKPGRPRCQAIQVELNEVATTKVEPSEPTYTSGRGWCISGMDVLYSPLPGQGTMTTATRTSK